MRLDRRRRPRRPLEEGDGAGSSGAEAGQHAAGIPVLGADLLPLRETVINWLSAGPQRSTAVAALRSLFRPRRQPGRRGRAVEDDDHTLADRDLLTRRPDEAPATPRALLGLARDRHPRPRRHREQRAGQRESAEHPSSGRHAAVDAFASRAR